MLGGKTSFEGMFSFNKVGEFPFALSLALGMWPGIRVVDNFGKNPDVDAGSVPETIWDYGGTYPWGNDAGDTVYISSSNNVDVQKIKLDVLTVDINGNFNEESSIVTLQGNTKVTVVTDSGNPIARVYRMQVHQGTASLLGDVYAYYNTTTTVPGVPDDDVNEPQFVQSMIKLNSGGKSGNYSKQLTYTIPTGCVGFLMRGEVSGHKGLGTDDLEAVYGSRRFGEIFLEKKDIGIMTSGSNTYQDNRPVMDILPAKTDLGVRVINTSANNMIAWGTLHILLIDEDLIKKHTTDPATGLSLLDEIGQIERITT